MQFHIQHNCISCSSLETYGAEIKHNGNQIIPAYQLVHHCEQQWGPVSTFLEKFSSVHGKKYIPLSYKSRPIQVDRKFEYLKFFLVNSVEFLALLGFTTSHTCTCADIRHKHTHRQTFDFFVKINNRTVQKNASGFNQKFVRKVLFMKSPDVHFKGLYNQTWENSGNETCKVD